MRRSLQFRNIHTSHLIRFKPVQHSTSNTVKNQIRTISKMNEEFPNVQDQSIYWYNEVNSTMDTARELLQANADKESFAVVAQSQLRGRGTRGRSWFNSPCNVFMTVGLKVKSIKIPLTLIPLRIGTLIFPTIESRVQTPGLTKLKWPNDILISDKKVCGILMEMVDDWLLIGIGCNVGAAPEIQGSGGEAGRPSTCIASFSPHIAAQFSQYDNQQERLRSEGENDKAEASIDSTSLIRNQDLPHVQLAFDIYQNIKDWIRGFTIPSSSESVGDSTSRGWLSRDSTDQVMRDFERNMDRSVQRLRPSANPNGSPPDLGSTENWTQVRPIRLNPDGTLEVMVIETGEQKTLVADYLY